MLISSLIWLPLLGALAVMFTPDRIVRHVALAFSCVVFLVGVVIATGFPEWHTAQAWPADDTIGWLDNFGISISLGVDSVSLLLVLLTVLLMPLCIWGSYSAVQNRQREYYGWLLALEAAMLGVFCARDVIFFYICFEFTLAPMFFLIAIYGGQNRSAAAIKFFLYTFTGSLLTLAGVIYVAWQYASATGFWSFQFDDLLGFAARELSGSEQAWLLLALMAGFAVKVPLFPVHTWLPLAHTEAPTAGSVILAGVMLKLGTYGLYLFVLPMVPLAVVEYAPLIGVLAIIGIIYAALICWVQTDVKKLIAYSSVSHLGFCVLGLFALNPLGLQGSILYMLNHGLSTGALFLCIGMIYERYHTRDMDRLGGLARCMPVWAFFMVFFTLSSVGLPGLNGFVSEFLCLIGAYSSTLDGMTEYPGRYGPWYALIAGTGMILAAMYLLIMLGKIVFGKLNEPEHGSDDGHPSLPTDLNAREILTLVPLAVLCVWIGFQPTALMDVMEPSVERTLAAYPDTVRQWELAHQPDTDEQILVKTNDHELMEFTLKEQAR